MTLPPPSTRAVVSAGLCPAGIGTARISRFPMSCISPPRFASAVSWCVFHAALQLSLPPARRHHLQPLRSAPSLSREDLPCAVSCCFSLSRSSRTPPSRAPRSQPPPPPALRRRTSQARG